MSATQSLGVSCPVPITDHSAVLMAHGGGGTLMQRLIRDVFLPGLCCPPEAGRHDSAVVRAGDVRIAFTTDSYVVQPLFFPGGDIGSLAVHGTVNDLAMSGAHPLALSAGFILEEGFPVSDLRKLVESMGQAARSCGVQIVTGDTKVVDRGKGDAVYINTAGIGLIAHDLDIQPGSVRPGDAVILSGDIGRHGIAIMAQREGLEFETTIESDSAAVSQAVQRLLDAGIDIHCLRDLTRGGLASALNEIATAASVGIELDEVLIPVRDDVRSACEILGFDPLYVACEGRFALFVPADQKDRALEALALETVAAGCAYVGHVFDCASPTVTIKTCLGTERIVDMLSGEQLPRIC